MVVSKIGQFYQGMINLQSSCLASCSRNLAREISFFTLTSLSPLSHETVERLQRLRLLCKDWFYVVEVHKNPVNLCLLHFVECIH